MQKLSLRALQVVAVAGLAGCLLSSGAAAERTVYHWTTDDGTFAYTDEEKNIPGRYRERIEVKTLKPLANYERFTAAETPALATRTPAAPPIAATDALAAGEGRGAPAISIRTGDENSPIIDVYPGSEEPIVIEKLRYKPDGGAVTRSNTIVRQGDRILTVIKPQSHEIDVTEFGDEEDLED